MTDIEKQAQAVYDAYRTNPEAGRSSQLYNHYKRGLAGLDAPPKDWHLAHAAWRAGRDTAKDS